MKVYVQIACTFGFSLPYGAIASIQNVGQLLMYYSEDVKHIIVRLPGTFRKKAAVYLLGYYEDPERPIVLRSQWP